MPDRIQTWLVRAFKTHWFTIYFVTFIRIDLSIFLSQYVFINQSQYNFSLSLFIYLCIYPSQYVLSVSLSSIINLENQHNPHESNLLQKYRLNHCCSVYGSSEFLYISPLVYNVYKWQKSFPTYHFHFLSLSLSITVN